MIILWLVMKQLFIWCNVIQGRKWCPVNQVGGTLNTLTPKTHRGFKLKRKSFSYIKQMTMFPFHNTILLRCVSTTCLMLNTLLKIKFESIATKFLSIIWSNAFNYDIEFLFNICNKILCHFCILKDIKSCTCKVIHHGKKHITTVPYFVPVRTSHIHIYSIG